MLEFQFATLALAAVTVATPAGRPGGYGGNTVSRVVSSLEGLLQGDLAGIGPFAPITNQILRDYVEPVEVGVSHRTATDSH